MRDSIRCGTIRPVSAHSTFRAKYVVPVEGPAIENGFVEVVDGRVAGLGQWDGASRRDVIDLGDSVLLPGFVNAHTHLELTCYAGQIPSAGLWTWIRKLIELRSQPGQLEREREAVRLGAELSLKAGVTTVGDISRMHLAWPVLKASPLRKVCFAELLCFAGEPARTMDELDAKVRETQADERLVVGISPHAPYSVTGEQIRGCVEMARQRHLPLTMHVAETPEERHLIEKGGGKLYYVFWWAGFLKKCPPPKRPLFQHLAECGLFEIPSLLAHMNYVEDRELDLLARSPCSVAYCPRAHRFHQHEGHRFREMLDRGINVCVGTDSLAGTESLSVLDDLRFLRREYPELDPALLLEMGTLRGARALQFNAQVGSIAPGKRADFAAIPLDAGGSRDPIVNVLESEASPVAVIIDGEPISLE